MKTLIVHDKDGNIVFTSSPAESTYKLIVEDVPNDRVPIKVNGDKVILDDTKEVKEVKEKLNEIEAEEQEFKKVPKVELLTPYIFKKGLNWSCWLC